jgi:hypothetical protein
MKKKSKPKNSSNNLFFGGIVIGVIIIAILFFSFGNISFSDDEDTSQNEIDISSLAPIVAGAEGRLYTENSDSVNVCKTKWLALEMKNDTESINGLLANGDCYIVPKDTKVLVLDLTTGVDKFRFLEGTAQGTVAWTIHENLLSLS